jgi:hypothetical protein
MKTFLALLLVSLIYTSSFSQTINTNISNGVTFDGEPYLAINPANPKNLVAAWMGLKLSNGSFKIAIKTRASFDGGNTWSSTVALPHMGLQYGSADPSLVFDKNGLLYACYIDYKKSPDSGGIYIARSVDGGLNWDTPSKAYDMYDDGSKKPIDRPWLVIDNSTTANFGTLYITSKPPQWVAPPNRNYFKASSDSGHTWSAIKNIDGGTHLIGNAIAQPMATPAVTTGGKFCAAYPSYVASQIFCPLFIWHSRATKVKRFHTARFSPRHQRPMILITKTAICSLPILPIAISWFLYRLLLLMAMPILWHCIATMGDKPGVALCG